MNTREVERTGRMLSVRSDPKTTASHGNDDIDDDFKALLTMATGRVWLYVTECGKN